MTATAMVTWDVSENRYAAAVVKVHHARPDSIESDGVAVPTVHAVHPTPGRGGPRGGATHTTCTHRHTGVQSGRHRVVLQVHLAPSLTNP
jgi:hypothetical protein